MTSNIYAIISPIAIGFILLEMIICWYYKKKYITFQEAVANFGTALGNQTMNVLVAAGVYVAYGFLWENYRLIDHLEMSAINFILLLLGIDFIFYWVHRWGHHVNIMWAAHSPHHSAEEMNFFVAVRASVTQRLFSFFFFWPLTLIAHGRVLVGESTGTCRSPRRFARIEIDPLAVTQDPFGFFDVDTALLAQDALSGTGSIGSIDAHRGHQPGGTRRVGRVGFIVRIGQSVQRSGQ